MLPCTDFLVSIPLRPVQIWSQARLSTYGMSRFPEAEELIPPRLSCPSKSDRARWAAIFFEDSRFLSWIYRLDDRSTSKTR